MTLTQNNIKKLNEIKELLGQLGLYLYTKPNKLLSGSTVGQHFRHILEFYICLKNGCTTGQICYDERERNLLIENNLGFARETIQEISNFLATVGEDYPLQLKANYSENGTETDFIPSSLFRELAYILDHTLHHLAIIKIGLSTENVKLNNAFGVAPSTLRFRKKCVL